MQEWHTKIKMKDITIIADSRASTTSAFTRIGANQLYKTLLKKNYKIPKSYIQWQELTALISLQAPEFNNKKFDMAQRYTSHRLALWVVHDAPIYCLEKQLLQQFQQTDIGNENLIFRDLIFQIPIHSLILLLPKDTVESPDGGYVDWLNIHCSDIRHPELSSGKKYGLSPHFLKHEHDVNLHLGCVDTKNTIWFSGWGINGDEGKIHQAQISYGRSEVGENDNDFVGQLRSITMQCLMFLSFEKLEIDNVTFKETINQTAFAKETKEKCLYPRWLRDTEKPQVRYIQKEGTHASPSPHWRRGHWRRSATGEGRTSHRWNWIKPAFVAGT